MYIDTSFNTSTTRQFTLSGQSPWSRYVLNSQPRNTTTLRQQSFADWSPEHAKPFVRQHSAYNMPPTVAHTLTQPVTDDLISGIRQGVSQYYYNTRVNESTLANQSTPQVLDDTTMTTPNNDGGSKKALVITYHQPSRDNNTPAQSDRETPRNKSKHGKRKIQDRSNTDDNDNGQPVSLMNHNNENGAQQPPAQEELLVVSSKSNKVKRIAFGTVGFCNTGYDATIYMLNATTLLPLNISVNGLHVAGFVVDYTAHGKREIQDRSKAITYHQPSRDNTLAQSDEETSRNKSKPEEIKQQDTSQIDDNDNGQPVGLMNHNNENGTQQQSVPEESSAVSSTSSAENGLEKKQAAQLNASDTNNKDNEQPADPISRDDSNDTQQLSVSEESPAVSSKSNKVKNISLLGIVGFGSLGCYSAIYTPNATMLLPLNISVNGLHFADFVVGYTAHGKREIQDRSKAITYHQPSRDNTLAQSDEETSRNKSKPEEIKQQDTSQIDDNDNGQPVGLMNHNNENGTQQQSVPEESSAVSSTSSAENGLEKKQAAQLNASDTNNKDNEQPADPISRDDSNDTQQLSVSEESPAVSSKSNKVKNISLLGIVGFGSLGCYSAIYTPNATMLLPGLNISLNYSHLAAGLAVGCAVVALTAWYYGSKKEEVQSLVSLILECRICKPVR